MKDKHIGKKLNKEQLSWRDRLQQSGLTPAQCFHSQLSPEQGASLTAVNTFLHAPGRAMMLNLPPGSGEKDTIMAVLRFWTGLGLQGALLPTTAPRLKEFTAAFAKNEFVPVLEANEFRCKDLKPTKCGDEEPRWKCTKRQGQDGDCPYRIAQKKAVLNKANNPLIFTIKSFLSARIQKTMTPVFPPQGGLLVVTDAHLLPEILADNLAVRVPVRLIEKLLQHDGSEDNDFKTWFFGPVSQRQRTPDGRGRLNRYRYT